MRAICRVADTLRSLHLGWSCWTVDWHSLVECSMWCVWLRIYGKEVSLKPVESRKGEVLGLWPSPKTWLRLMSQRMSHQQMSLIPELTASKWPRLAIKLLFFESFCSWSSCGNISRWNASLAFIAGFIWCYQIQTNRSLQLSGHTRPMHLRNVNQRFKIPYPSPPPWQARFSQIQSMFSPLCVRRLR